MVETTKYAEVEKKNTLENNIQNCENNIKMEDITKLLKEMRELMTKK